MSVPTVVTDIRGCRETVDQGVNGLMFPAGDADALALALTERLQQVCQQDRHRRRPNHDYLDTAALAQFLNGNVERAIELANEYDDIVVAINVGNEALVDWNDHMVPVENLVEYVREVKKSIKQPVTFCENYVPWTYKLEPLAEELDFIAVHTYPAWEYRSIHDALEFTKQHYHSVVDHYPGKPVIITEAGWTTAANGRGIDPHNASEELQASYSEQLLEWTTDEKILTFVFEAFDEPWKGSPDPMEPEKHWGLFDVERKPKLVMQEMYEDYPW